MHMPKTTISAGQFFVAMFVSRVLVTLHLNALYTGGENLLDSVVSCLLAMATGLVLSLPIWLAARKSPEASVPELAVRSMGPLGRLVPLAYGLYFVVTGAASLTLFQIFLMDTVNPGFSAGWVIAALVGAALFGALRGLETCARSAVCVFAVLILSCGLVFSIAAGRFRTDHLEPLFYNGFSQTGKSFLLFLARASLFGDMGVLLPRVRGRRKTGFAACLAGIALFVGVTLVLTVGCLGRYAYTQNFPIYVLASLTEVRSLQRLDAVLTGVWMMGLIIQLAFDLYACRVCFFSLSRKKEPRWTACILAGAMLLLAVTAARSAWLQGLLLSSHLLLWCTLTVGVLLPLLVLAAARKSPKEKEAEK